MMFQTEMGKAMSGVADFGGLVGEFQQACSGTSPEATLDAACKLLTKLRLVMQRSKMANSDEEGSPTSEAAKEFNAALERLTKVLDAQGLAWLKKSIQSGQPFDASKTLSQPTKFLEGCVLTANLCSDNLSQEIGDSFADVAEIMPTHTKVASINKELMKELSPEKLEQCDLFITAVDEKLTEHLDCFKKSISQLEKLNKKYEFVG